MVSLTDVAVWAGRHALPLFFAGLGVLLVTTGFCGWGGRQWIVRAAKRSPNEGLAVTCGICLLMMIVGVGTFMALATELATDSALVQADHELTATVRARSHGPTMQVFSAFTRLADARSLMVLCIGVAVLLLLSRQRWLMLPWVVALAGNGQINGALKQAFARVRPLQPDGFFLEHGYSFPSGHSSGSVVACGMLAYLAMRGLPGRWHLAIGLFAVALAFTVCASRVFLQVHYASDVLAGIASGTAWLATCLAVTEFTRWKIVDPH